MTMITIKIPQADKHGKITHRSVTGQKMLFSIGGKRIAFVLHPELPHMAATILTHAASGFRVGDISGILAANMHGGKTLTNRAACEALLDQAIAKNGVDRVLDVIQAAPVIN